AILSVIVLAFGAKDVALKVKAEQVRLNFMALDSRFRGFLFILAIFTLGNSSDAFLVLLAQQRGLSIAGVLGMLITFNAVYALLAGPAGALSDRVGRRRLMIMGWLAYAILYLGFAITISAWQIWALYALYGLYYAATEGAAKALVADLVPSEQRGTAYGYYNAAIGIMALPASLLAGILWQGFGPSAPFVAGFALALTAGILLLLWFQRTQQARGNG
ncbi:MAG TPA: MFS transporter, partial [Aggregatilineales bacterium]|nr:MFS transporter [Aggregatilineales bacterium]